MKKRDLAGLTFRSKQLEQLNSHSLECLVEVVQTTFSVIATSDPHLANTIIDQLHRQKEGILQFLANREAEEKEYIDMVCASMSDTLELTDDGEVDEEIV